MSMSNSRTLFDLSQAETSVNQNQKDQHCQLERIETRVTQWTLSVASAGKETSCYYILCCVVDWHRETPCCLQQLLFFFD